MLSNDKKSLQKIIKTVLWTDDFICVKIIKKRGA